MGQEVEASLLPVALMMANGMLIEQEILKLDRGRVGNRGQAVAPCDIFRLGDKWVLLQTSGTPMFKRWCRMIGRPESDRRSRALPAMTAGRSMASI